MKFIRGTAGVGLLIGLGLGVSSGLAQPLDSLLREATPLGDVAGFENEYVRVHYTLFEYRAANRREAEDRPIVLYIDLTPGPGILNPARLLPPDRARPSWRSGVMPRAVRIERLAPPPDRPGLGTAGTDLPRGTVEARAWDDGRLLIAAFRPMDYGAGAGPYPSVTTFLSDGVVEVSTRGLRRRMAVQAGDAFWFDAATRITVVDDVPVGAAIVQLFRVR